MLLFYGARFCILKTKGLELFTPVSGSCR